MNIDLQGKSALVCGSSKGIGKAIAFELASLGAEVCMLSRSEEKLKQLVAELDTSKGQQHSYLAADLSDPSALKEQIQSWIGGKTIHILINNAGGPAPGPAIEAEELAFRQAFNTHLIAGQILAQACVPGMKEAGYGRIINIISTSVKQPIPGLGVSNTIRGAVANWSKTLSVELGPFGITVNNVLPGFTDTERLHQIAERRAEAQGKTRQEILDQMAAGVPARRLAEPEELAQAAAFLASPAASYINGINVPVDGGRTSCL